MPELDGLFEPITIRGTRIRNRVVMSAMNDNMAAYDGTVTSRQVDYYAARAAGGVGLVVTGNAFVDDDVSRVSAFELGAHSHQMLAGMGRLSEEVQNRGAALVVQLAHAGVQTLPETIGFRQVVAPSAEEFVDVARELSVSDIQRLVADFAAAAQRVDRAGATGVEIHAGHGYLLSSFVSPLTNRRSDGYGGSLEKRLRILREIIDLSRAQTRDDFVIGIKFNSSDMVKDGLSLDEAVLVGQALESFGFDYLSVSRGVADSVDHMIPPLYYARMGNVEAARRIRSEVSVPVIVVGSIHDPQEAAGILERGEADLVALARSLLADPEWPRKARSGAVSTIRPCIRCNECVALVDENREVRCAVNPWVGREATRSEPATNARHLVVIGGGPSGCEAARVAASRGHRVTLLEKRDRLGGASVPTYNPEFKRELDRLPAWYAEQLERAGVDVRLAHDATVDSVLTLAPDVVAFARGAAPIPSPLEAPDDARVVQAVEVLDREPGTGQDVVVVGAGFVGCETAVHLARSGHRVSLLTRRRTEDLAADLNYTVRLALRALMEESKVRIVPTCTPRELTASGIVVVDDDGEDIELAADLVVVARGFTQDTALADALRDKGVEVHLIGETVRTGLILNAVHQGFAFGLGV